MSTDPELSVRRYLAFLDDPSSAVDQDAVASAEAAFAGAADPLSRLHAAADLEKARSADAGALEADFIRDAKAYAEAQDIPAAAFTAVGVPSSILAKAGLGAAGGRGPGSVRRSSGAARSPQVPVSHLKAVAGQMPKRFTLSQLADRAGGGSPATVRKAVRN